MKVVRFEIEGLFNSFRIPFFKSYHKSFLAPPKSTIIGLLCNIANKNSSEFLDILNNDLISVSVVILDIKGKVKDLWSYKTFEKKNRGKSIVRRDKLFKPYYVVYLNIKEEKLKEELVVALNKPKNIPSLGLDDELVVLKNVKEIELIENATNTIDSIHLSNEANYKILIKDITKVVELPTFYEVPTKFKLNKTKEIIESKKQIEFLNCQIEVDIESFLDKEKNLRVAFY